ncbi:hemin-degrading factor [Stutzerimonas nosocomialis]|uniref:hemin-degrading factor n=1 Tax=Stutzerimonas nosocomialis TaxID=1056496 RepID=UPI0011090B3F|nr:ChuX/HutX family heme-like substrate-binding protein [Stutzerimonas nosocomialis]TLX59113.1 hemin-degrading factor [Stutzerimonas nosocomialis]
MSLTASPSTLYQNWQALRQAQPALRARDAAAALAVSEAELVASRLGIDAVRLQPNWRELLPALEPLGRIMALTRNEHCVHERKGVYRDVTIGGNGQMGLVVSPDIDLRLFLTGWSSAFAVNEQTPRGMQRSLQVFDHQGVAVHKVYLTEDSDQDAWAALTERFAEPDQGMTLDLQPHEPAAIARPDAAIDVDVLRLGWSELKDTHHFFALLKKHGVQRTQALRLAGRDWAERLPLTELPMLFERAAVSQVPIMVFVGNRHCIQIHTGPVNSLRWMDHWFNVLDPDFNLHLDVRGVTELWRVRKPSSDGVITSWEAFDAQGELVVQLFGARKPGIPEREDWRALAEAPAAVEA